MDDAYRRLRDYADGLAWRQQKLDAWHRRNPNAEDLDDDQYRELVARDPKPRTDDLVTAQRFHDLLAVALAAYDGRKPDRRDRREAAMWWLLVGLIAVSLFAVAVLAAWVLAS